jgi:hypothetical protein
MSDPYSVLQPAIRAGLIAHAPLTALVGQRVYDRVPSAAVFPYLTLDLSEMAEDDNGCGLNWEAVVRVHIWSRATGRAEASLISGPIRKALDAIPLTLTDTDSPPNGYVITVNQYRSTRLMTDPDGLTTHGIVEQRLRIRRSA